MTTKIFNGEELESLVSSFDPTATFCYCLKRFAGTLLCSVLIFPSICCQSSKTYYAVCRMISTFFHSMVVLQCAAPFAMGSLDKRANDLSKYYLFTN